jgi:hypothetical protein
VVDVVIPLEFLPAKEAPERQGRFNGHVRGDIISPDG